MDDACPRENSTVKVLILMAGLGFTSIALAFAPQSWVQEAGLDVWNVPKLYAEIAATRKHSEELEESARSLVQQLAVKDQLVKELLNGHMDLASVTDQFHELNCDGSNVIVYLRVFHQVDDTRELSALNVMAFVDKYLDDDSQKARKSTIKRKLDCEFDAMFPDK